MVAPFFWVVTQSMARNQTGSGVRVSRKIVPAVTEVWQPQAAHSSSTLRTVHDLPPPQRGHRKPFGHRSRTRYARQASSVAKAASNPSSFAGIPLPRLNTTHCGHLSQADTLLINLQLE